MTERETEWDTGLEGERLASRIVQALDRQLALFRRLDSLSRRQREVVSAGDTDQLLGVLGERQEVIEQLERLGEQLRPIRRGWDSMLERIPVGRRAEVRDRLDALADLAAGIAARDEGDRRVLEERRGAIAGEVNTLGRARGAAGAYSASDAVSSPRFQDVEG